MPPRGRENMPWRMLSSMRVMSSLAVFVSRRQNITLAPGCRSSPMAINRLAGSMPTRLRTR